MVCVLEESDIMCQCAVQDMREQSEGCTDTTALFQMPGSTSTGDFLQTVASRFKSEPNSIKLVFIAANGDERVFPDSSTETLLSMGLLGDNNCNSLVLKHRRKATRSHVSSHRRVSKQNENYPTYNMPPPPALMSASQDYAYTTAALIKQDTGYVGLVNQAMTCYLNSLLQALYMTPEFRNALYNWQYDPKKDSNNPGKCIPYQLQRLFLNLQTSRKTAVETTELTRSFGWDSSEAWQQHDIQELCRVMFDALEQTFKDTKQADLIDRLYQGKMIDYVKCLECSKEKFREDTFLDIPLPVRPFGSTVAYGSLEEALKAFVQPETLDGANQYFCESCAKKCDAHKGLKFKRFPYLLTLHLKRFDFDYSTMHRIKLNDRVAFPEILDLNELIEQELVAEKEEGSEGLPEELTVSKCDDSSTTDSGSALDDEGCQGGADQPHTNACDMNHLSDELAINKNGDGSTTENMLTQDGEVCEGATNLPSSSACDMNQEDDEGIDISSNHQENEKNRQHGLNKGPHIYELFSIMIHSGSASGGHYYAYIKDFSNGEWFCFNDTSVTKITNDDISKTYGGGALRGYYSGAYSSSTNAYMLMYRQINETLNCDPMKIEEFPEYIKEVLSEMQSKQEKDRKFRDEMIKLKVFCHHPHKGMIDGKVYVHNDSTLEEVTSEAHNVFKLGGLIDEENCRLVSYNATLESIEMSFGGREKELFIEVMQNAKYDDLLLDIKNKDEEFISYEPGDSLFPLKPYSWLHWFSKVFVDLCNRLMIFNITSHRFLCPPLINFTIYNTGSTMKVFVVDVEKDEVEPFFITRSLLSSTVGELKMSIADAPQVSIKAEDMVILVEKHTNNYQPLENEFATLQQENFSSSDKVYVCRGPLEKKPYNNSKVHILIDRFEHVITLHFNLPDTDPDTLAHMSIPSLSAIQAAASKQAGDASTPPPLEKVLVEPAVVKSGSRGLMLPLILAGGGEEEGGGASSGGAGGGHSDQSASEDSSLTDSDRTLIGDVQDECMSEGDNQSASPPEEDANALPMQEEEDWVENQAKQYFTYFKAHPYEADTKKILKVDVDKRMPIESLKSHLESFLGVPANCFKIYRYSDCESLRTRTVESLNDLKTEEQLSIRLVRELTSDEHKLKVYQLTLNAPQPIKYFCETIVAKGRTIGQTKKEIINELNKKHNLNLQYDKCRLRKKSWKNVGRIYLDSQLWVDDVMVYSNGEVLLQELPEPETVKSTSQLSVFVRHWRPSTLTMGPFEELILDNFRIDELKQKLSEKSSIPVQHIDIAKPTGLFPCELSVLSIQELEWSLKIASLENWPLQFSEDGGVLFYKDNREEQKTLTTEERNELSTKEATRLNGLSGAINTYSPRKERPLKIYFDRRPCPAIEAADMD